jgi:hypothetical protein
MEIATQLDDDHAGKLAYIQTQTSQDLTEILNQAIDLYYQKLNPTQDTPSSTALEDPLIGLFSGSPNLATQAEEILQQEVKPESGWTWKQS